MAIFLVTRGRFTRGGKTERRAVFECGVLSLTTKLFNEFGIDEESDFT